MRSFLTSLVTSIVPILRVYAGSGLAMIYLDNNRGMICAACFDAALYVFTVEGTVRIGIARVLPKRCVYSV